MPLELDVLSMDPQSWYLFYSKSWEGNTRLGSTTLSQDSGCHVWTPLLIHQDATANCSLPNSEVHLIRAFYIYFSDRFVHLAHLVVYYLKRNGDDDVFVGKAGSRGHDWLVSEQWGGNMLLLGENLCNALVPGNQYIETWQSMQCTSTYYLVPSTQYTRKWEQCSCTKCTSVKNQAESCFTQWEYALISFLTLSMRMSSTEDSLH